MKFIIILACSFQRKEVKVKTSSLYEQWTKEIICEKENVIQCISKSKVKQKLGNFVTKLKSKSIQNYFFERCAGGPVPRVLPYCETFFDK